MARPEDCIGLSGYNSFHNSQYVHLFGRDVKAGDLLTSTVRMEGVGNDALELDTLDDLAVDRYQAWVE